MDSAEKGKSCIRSVSVGHFHFIKKPYLLKYKL